MHIACATQVEQFEQLSQCHVSCYSNLITCHAWLVSCLPHSRRLLPGNFNESDKNVFLCFQWLLPLFTPCPLSLPIQESQSKLKCTFCYHCTYNRAFAYSVKPINKVTDLYIIATATTSLYVDMQEQSELLGYSQYQGTLSQFLAIRSQLRCLQLLLRQRSEDDSVSSDCSCHHPRSCASYNIAQASSRGGANQQRECQDRARSVVSVLQLLSILMLHQLAHY